ncbi:MAG: hypothetical protein WCY77_10265 [Weeksellaceae bacterium]
MSFNSRQYEWADLTLILGGRDITGVRGIKYEKSIEREPVYAKGRTAHSIQSGNEAVTGEIRMLQSEFESLVSAGNGSVLGLALDALVAYGNPATGDNMQTDRIETIRFTSEASELNQNDKFQEISLPFIAIDVKRQV